MPGARIKAYMEEAGIKQTVLWEDTGLHPQAVNEILNKQRKMEVEEYYVICKALKKPLSYFF